MATTTARAAKAKAKKTAQAASRTSSRVSRGRTSRAAPAAEAPRHTGRAAASSEELVVCAAALVCGAAGFEVRALWFVSIVLMALLMGLLGARLRAAGGRGVISEVVAGAKEVADEVGEAAGR